MRDASRLRCFAGKKKRGHATSSFGVRVYGSFAAGLVCRVRRASFDRPTRDLLVIRGGRCALSVQRGVGRCAFVCVVKDTRRRPHPTSALEVGACVDDLKCLQELRCSSGGDAQRRTDVFVDASSWSRADKARRRDAMRDARRAASRSQTRGLTTRDVQHSAAKSETKHLVRSPSQPLSRVRGARKTHDSGLRGRARAGASLQRFAASATLSACGATTGVCPPSTQSDRKSFSALGTRQLGTELGAQKCTSPLVRAPATGVAAREGGAGLALAGGAAGGCACGFDAAALQVEGINALGANRVPAREHRRRRERGDDAREICLVSERFDPVAHGLSDAFVLVRDELHPCPRLRRAAHHARMSPPGRHDGTRARRND